jgi:hypothetical protein
MTVWSKHRALERGEMAVPPREPVERITQGAGFVFIAGVGGIVHIQTGHFVEADNAVDWPTGQVTLNPGSKSFVATVIAHGLCGHEDDIETWRHFPLP